MNAQSISDMPVDIFVFTSAQTQYIVTLSSTLNGELVYARLYWRYSIHST